MDDEEGEEGGEVVLGVQGETGKVPRARLLQFHTNQTPASWGTWTKR